MQYLDELQKLKLPNEEYALFGGITLSVLNLREAGDIDLIVKDCLWSKLSEEYPVTEKKGREFIAVGNIDITKSWPQEDYPFSIDELIDTADIIDGIRHIKLEHTLALKRYLNRPKDHDDIAMIRKYMNSQR